MSQWGGYDCMNKCPCGSESTSPATFDLQPHDFAIEASELDVTPQEVEYDFEKGMGGLDLSTANLVGVALGAGLVAVSALVKMDARVQCIVRGLGTVMSGFAISQILKSL